MDAFDLDGPNPWRTRSERVVFDNGRMRLRDDVVEQPDGLVGTYAFLVVDDPVVTIVALEDDNSIYLVRQWRYPWQRNSWELPSGGGEAGETPLEAAQRELAEEVRLRAAEWESLGEGYSTATVDSHWHFFLARGLSLDNSRGRDGAEGDMLIQRVPLAQAVDAAMSDRIQHGMSVAGILRAARRLGI